MANKIRMTPEELRDAKRALDNYRSELDNLLSKSNRRVKAVNAEWEGASQKAFMERYQQLYNKINPAFPEAITEIGQKLNEAAQTLEQADADIAGKLSR